MSGGEMYEDGRGGSAVIGRLLVAAVIVIISLISYFGHSDFNPVTHKNQHVGGITPRQEESLGLEAAKGMAAQYGGIDSDRRRQELVNQIGHRIIENSDVKESPYHFDFHVLADNKTINAFALPGGQVFITDALFARLKTPGQLAGVLGHEIGHVVDRHGGAASGQAALDARAGRGRRDRHLRSRTIATPRATSCLPRRSSNSSTSASAGKTNWKPIAWASAIWPRPASTPTRCST